MAALANTSALTQLKSRLLLDSQKLTSMKILRILKDNEVKYDFYLEFTLSDQSFFGVIKDATGLQPKVISEAFSDSNLVLTREWITRTKGQIVKIIKQWLNPVPGRYKSLQNDINAYNMKTGNLTKINKDVEVDVKTSLDDCKIIIQHENDFYTLQNDSFVYFNYWFIKLDEEFE